MARFLKMLSNKNLFILKCRLIFSGSQWEFPLSPSIVLFNCGVIRLVLLPWYEEAPSLGQISLSCVFAMYDQIKSPSGPAC